MCSFTYYLSLNHIVLSSLIHHLTISTPQLIEKNYLFSFSEVHCIAPRSVEKNWCHFCQEFANSVNVFLIWKSFLFWNQISYFKGHVNSSLIVEMKSERCQFLKVFLEIKLCWSKIQHTLFNVVLWLSCILREKKNWLVVRLKWLFPWFFVSILNSNFGYIFWLSVMRWPFMNFKRNKVPESKLEALSRKIVSFS
jgi:CRISPR/Cas system-associated endoribonuclease Cas2